MQEGSARKASSFRHQEPDMGAFHHSKSLGNFGREINLWRFFSQNGQTPEVVSFEGWAGPTEPSRSISKNFCFQSYFPKQQQNFGRNTYVSFRCD